MTDQTAYIFSMNMRFNGNKQLRIIFIAYKYKQLVSLVITFFIHIQKNLGS